MVSVARTGTAPPAARVAALAIDRIAASVLGPGMVPSGPAPVLARRLASGPTAAVAPTAANVAPTGIARSAVTVAASGAARRTVSVPGLGMVRSGLLPVGGLTVGDVLRVASVGPSVTGAIAVSVPRREIVRSGRQPVLVLRSAIGPIVGLGLTTVSVAHSGIAATVVSVGAWGIAPSVVSVGASRIALSVVSVLRQGIVRSGPRRGRARRSVSELTVLGSRRAVNAARIGIAPSVVSVGAWGIARGVVSVLRQGIVRSGPPRVRVLRLAAGPALSSRASRTHGRIAPRGRLRTIVVRRPATVVRRRATAGRQGIARSGRGPRRAPSAEPALIAAPTVGRVCGRPGSRAANVPPRDSVTAQNGVLPGARTAAARIAQRATRCGRVGRRSPIASPHRRSPRTCSSLIWIVTSGRACAP